MNRKDYKKIEELHDTICEDFKQAMKEVFDTGIYYEMMSDMVSQFRTDPSLRPTFISIFGEDMINRAELMIDTGALMCQIDERVGMDDDSKRIKSEQKEIITIDR
jgi:hypothetical protein